MIKCPCMLDSRSKRGLRWGGPSSFWIYSVKKGGRYKLPLAYPFLSHYDLKWRGTPSYIQRSFLFPLQGPCRRSLNKVCSCLWGRTSWTSSRSRSKLIVFVSSVLESPTLKFLRGRIPSSLSNQTNQAVIFGPRNSLSSIHIHGVAGLGEGHST